MFQINKSILRIKFVPTITLRNVVLPWVTENMMHLGKKSHLKGESKLYYLNFIKNSISLPAFF